MAVLSQLVGELIRAANRAGNFAGSRACSIAGSCLRHHSGGPRRNRARSRKISQSCQSLIGATGFVGGLSDQEIKGLLLDAAEMISTIKIVLDAKHAHVTR